MKRRDFLACGAACLGMGAFSMPGQALSQINSRDGWRTFELKTLVNMPATEGKTKLWLPIPQRTYMSCQITESNDWTGNFSRAALHESDDGRVQALYVEWDDGRLGLKERDDSTSGMKVELVSRVSTMDYSVPLPPAKPGLSIPTEDMSRYLRSTPNSPTDGIVLATANKIVGGRKDHWQVAKAVYDWIVDNGSRDSATAGCGTGDVVAMLESGKISGKCADLNGLFVALVKSMGVPARHSFGIRVAPSRFARSLGTSSADVTKAQHCRAEFFLKDYGWIPVDPSDVLKIVLEENVSLASDRIALERARLLGSWEMNWVAFNTAKDFKISPPAKADIEFFMYPRAETGGRVWNHLDSKAFGYQIQARELMA